MMSTPRSYRRGVSIVVGVVLVSAVVAAAGLRQGKPARAAQDLGALAEPLGQFQFVDQSGRTVTERDLADRVCIVSFIFTRCQLSCPRISSIMKGLQAKLDGSPVLLVSISVDPDHDTPQVLGEYAASYGARPDRWWFLTGPRQDIYDLIQHRFKLSVMPNPDPTPAAEAIAHSDRLALVVNGRVAGLFSSNEPADLDALISRARRSAKPAWVRALPSLNAGLNTLCSCLLILGWISIRRPAAAGAGPIAEPGAKAPRSPLDLPYVRRHRAFMLSAVATAVLFFASYLTYHYQVGSTPFQGTGPSRLLYFTILLSHTVLAAFGVVPLVTLTLIRALRGDFARHRVLAATTLPIWLYVSVTGVIIYFMLYHFPATVGTST